MKYYICSNCKKAFSSVGKKSNMVHCDRRLTVVSKEQHAQHKKNLKHKAENDNKS